MLTIYVILVYITIHFANFSEYNIGRNYTAGIPKGSDYIRCTSNMRDPSENFRSMSIGVDIVPVVRTIVTINVSSYAGFYTFRLCKM